MKLLRKTKVPELLNLLNKSYEVVAPVLKDGNHFFDPIESGEDVSLDYLNSVLPPKEFLFPQNETIFEYAKGRGGTSIEPKVETKQRIIFGLRPCDLNGILLLDRVFSEDFEDPYYLSRRENTILISLACNQPGERCFCDSLGTGPSLEQGYDLLLTDLDDTYLVEVGSPRGEEILNLSKDLFKEAGRSEIEKKEILLTEAREKFVTKVDFDGVEKRIEELFEDKIWKEIGAKCLRCGGCSFVCPTCHCFNLVDKEAEENEGRRIRGWDSCLFSGFTRMAGDINPRVDRDLRVRQRFSCKLNYYIKNYGAYGCVGCGRCTDTCLGHIDMAEVVRKIKGND